MSTENLSRQTARSVGMGGARRLVCLRQDRRTAGTARQLALVSAVMYINQ